jgi:hypothetical protein
VDGLKTLNATFMEVMLSTSKSPDPPNSSTQIHICLEHREWIFIDQHFHQAKSWLPLEFLKFFLIVVFDGKP